MFIFFLLSLFLSLSLSCVNKTTWKAYQQPQYQSNVQNYQQSAYQQQPQQSQQPINYGTAPQNQSAQAPGNFYRQPSPSGAGVITLRKELPTTQRSAPVYASDPAAHSYGGKYYSKLQHKHESWKYIYNKQTKISFFLKCEWIFWRTVGMTGWMA